MCCSCARGSTKRQLLYEKAGHFQVIFCSMHALNKQSSEWAWGDRMTGLWFLQVPYLEDPNTGVQMFESAEIVDYLRATYAVWEENSSVAWGIFFLMFLYTISIWHTIWEIHMLEQLLENNRISNYSRALVPYENTVQVILQWLCICLSLYMLNYFKDAISLSLQSVCTEETKRYSSRLDNMKRQIGMLPYNDLPSCFFFFSSGDFDTRL